MIELFLHSVVITTGFGGVLMLMFGVPALVVGLIAHIVERKLLERTYK